MMKYINIDEWYRKTQYNNFIQYSNPVFSVGTILNVTKLVQFCETNDLSFFSAFLFIITKSVNEVEEMKLRIKEDGIVLLDEIHPGYVVLCENKELRTCVTRYNSSFSKFYQDTREDIQYTRSHETKSYNDGVGSESFYVSCLPWIRLNSISNPYNFADREQTSIPRITWGKYYKNGDEYEINFDVSVHHALADGMQVSELIQKIENRLSTLDCLGD